MNNIKYLIAVTALATALGPVVNVQAGLGRSRLLVVDELQREEYDKAVRLQVESEALLTSARSENVNDAIQAVAARANVNKADKRGWTPLIEASTKGQRVKKLRRAKAGV